MTRQKWFATGRHEKFKEIISDPVFEDAIMVIFGEIMQAQTDVMDLNTNALVNRFREGVVFGLSNLPTLAIAPVPRDKIPTHKPWEKKRPEIDELDKLAEKKAAEDNE